MTRKERIAQGRIDLALKTAWAFGSIDGSHHKTWVIDQMVRALTADGYKEWVRNHNSGGYEWDEGIAP